VDYFKVFADLFVLQARLQGRIQKLSVSNDGVLGRSSQRCTGAELLVRVRGKPSKRWTLFHTWESILLIVSFPRERSKDAKSEGTCYTYRRRCGCIRHTSPYYASARQDSVMWFWNWCFIHNQWMCNLQISFGFFEFFLDSEAATGQTDRRTDQ